ncbi:MAG: acyl-ACP--UDP-N-acetylglucosamine O-acyltransferase [Deltaproteobacteria bacterium]|nr:acyl-ACP--UDP-N-acetylglucosamine O-acyltransferase [Deltaproteobacteria bacterium]
MVVSLHPTAVIGEGVTLGEGTTIGPFAVVESGAVVGRNNQLGAGTYLYGSVVLGDGNRLMRGASLGGWPQDLGYKGEPTRLMVGDSNFFGENTTVHRGSTATGETIVGSHNFIMVNTHIGHDCRVGSHIIAAPGVMLGGHVRVDDRANLGGGVAVHQACRVGSMVMVGGLSRVTQDVLPYTMVNGDNTLVGLNRVGLKRNGHTPAQTKPLKQAFLSFCRRRQSQGELMEWLETELHRQGENPLLSGWLTFLRSPSKRGFARGAPAHSPGLASPEREEV